MIDLVEGMKVVSALAPTTQGANGTDYIEMKNAHVIWTLVSVKDHTSGLTVTPQVASDVAGTGVTAVSGGAKFWINNNTTNLDRMAASTNSTAAAFSDAANDGL
jgi:hypothetical protein